jgi:hypothetical protein
MLNQDLHDNRPFEGGNMIIAEVSLVLIVVAVGVILIRKVVKRPEEDLLRRSEPTQNRIWERTDGMPTTPMKVEPSITPPAVAPAQLSDSPRNDQVTENTEAAGAMQEESLPKHFSSRRILLVLSVGMVVVWLAGAVVAAVDGWKVDVSVFPQATPTPPPKAHIKKEASRREKAKARDKARKLKREYVRAKREAQHSHEVGVWLLVIGAPIFIGVVIFALWRTIDGWIEDKRFDRELRRQGRYRGF